MQRLDLLVSKCFENFLVFERKFRDSGHVSKSRADLCESITVNDLLFDDVPIVAKGSDFLDGRLSGGKTSRSSSVVDKFSLGNIENTVKQITRKYRCVSAEEDVRLTLNLSVLQIR